MDYKIPLFKLNYDEAEEQAALDTVRSRWVSSGPKCAKLEEKFSSMLGARYALATCNCTAALHMAMICAGIGPGDEVIVPSLSFVATANVVRYVGATPVFVDIRSLSDPTIDPEMVEKKVTDRTKAIIVMHYGGFACDMDMIMDIAARHGLKVIEDACHGPMGEYHGKKLGTIGNIGCFSFFSNKNISTGEGGVFITNDEKIYEKAKLIRSHGMTTMSYERSKGHSTSYDVVELGYNYRMDDIRASIAVVQLDKLEADIEKRQVVRKSYIEKLRDCERVIIPFEDYTDKSSSYVFPIVIKDVDSEKRDEIRAELDRRGIQTSIHYPAIHRFEIYGEYACELPATEKYCDTEITLPMYGSLTEDEMEYICNNLLEILA